MKPRDFQARALLLPAALLLAGCRVYAAAGPIEGWPPRIVQPHRHTPFETTVLALHNAERARLGIAPLAWDPALAQAAAAYAAEIARRGTLRHSARAARPGQGENLWMGTRGAYSLEHMLGGWLAERRYFRPGIFPDVSSDGDWSHVGHYTAMIWPGTTQLGCAVRGSLRDDYLVCRYAPSGNINGRRLP